jgi:hypothetical protein
MTVPGYVVAILVGAGVVLVFALLVWLERRQPAIEHGQVIEALETTERIGASDIDTDIDAVFRRRRHLREGVRHARKYRLEAHQDRIKAQLMVLEPYAERIDAYARTKESFSLDLPVNL